MNQQNSNLPIHQNFGLGASHERPLSWPVFFANNALPPLSPFPRSELSMASVSSSLMDVTIDDKSKCSLVSGTKIKCGDNSIEAENASKTCGASGVKRITDGDISPITRHFRSFSMDSTFANLTPGDKSPMLPAFLAKQVGQFSPRNSFNESLLKSNFDIRSCEFSEAELKKIMADEKLAEVAARDPKQAKRILANRHSAALSKERKLRYISELERRVHTLQTEATTLSAQITIMQKDLQVLKCENDELKFRLQSMDQQSQLREALHESLTVEVQSLKLELRDNGKIPNHGSHMFQMQCQHPGKVHV